MTKIAEKSKQEYGDLLKEKDHLQDMEQLEMTIVSIQTPYPSIVRIQGKSTHYNQSFGKLPIWQFG